MENSNTNNNYHHLGFNSDQSNNQFSFTAVSNQWFRGVFTCNGDRELMSTVVNFVLSTVARNVRAAVVWLPEGVSDRPTFKLELRDELHWEFKSRGYGAESFVRYFSPSKYPKVSSSDKVYNLFIEKRRVLPHGSPSKI